MKAEELLAKFAAGQRQFAKADLREADMNGANLRGAYLNGADLRGTLSTGIYGL